MEYGIDCKLNLGVGGGAVKPKSNLKKLNCIKPHSSD